MTNVMSGDLAVQAAMLRVFLPRLTGWNEARREAAARYAELGLGEIGRASCRERVFRTV